MDHFSAKITGNVFSITEETQFINLCPVTYLKITLLTMSLPNRINVQAEGKELSQKALEILIAVCVKQEYQQLLLQRTNNYQK
jgi:hypothetical protein